MQEVDAKEWERFFDGLCRLPRWTLRRLRELPGRISAFLPALLRAPRFRWARIMMFLIVVLVAGIQWGIPAWRHWWIRPAAGKPIFHAPVLAVISTSDPGYLQGDVWTSPEEWGVIVEYPFNLLNKDIPYISSWGDSSISNKWGKLKYKEDGIHPGFPGRIGFGSGAGLVPREHVNKYQVTFEGHSETTKTSHLGGESLWFPTRWVRTSSVIFKGNLKVSCGDDLLVEQASDFVDPMQDKMWILYDGKYILFTDFPYFQWGKDGKPYYHFYVIKVPHPKIIDWDHLDE